MIWGEGHHSSGLILKVLSKDGLGSLLHVTSWILEMNFPPQVLQVSITCMGPCLRVFYLAQSGCVDTPEAVSWDAGEGMLGVDSAEMKGAAVPICYRPTACHQALSQGW